ncbi:MAG: hypothetical protein PHD03_01530 [Bacilli bacterium]|nr:hypothetical protein [Bacilli bacterium]MDD4407236.1 hypothetical protein [Bacilli bacterium]
MKKKILVLIFILFITSLFISPNIVLANNLNNTNNTNNNIVLLKKDKGSSDDGNVSEIEENNSDDQVCEGLLGPTLKKDIEFILNVMKIIAPLLIVIFTIYELISAIVSKDDDALTKALGRLKTRIILVAILFFLPVLLNLLLGFIDNKYSTCLS